MTTSYVRDMLDECLEGGLDGELRELAARDSAMFGRLGVDNERERNLVLYLDFFLDDLAEEMGRPLPVDRGLVIQAAFEKLRGRKDVDLTDIRRAVFAALAPVERKAYHNTMGLLEDNTRPQRDLGKWIGTLGEMFAAERAGESRNRAVDRLTRGWDPVERADFAQWMRYYEKGDHEKYGLRTTAAEEERMPPGELMRKQLSMRAQPEQQPEQQKEPQPVPVRRTRGRPPRTSPKTLQDRKSFIIGRLDAIRRELRQFVGAWPTHVWNELYQTLADLEQQIVGLRTESSMRDCLIRAAGLWERHGVAGGASAIRRIAQGEDVVSQIEKALTGREYETKPGAPSPADMEGAGGLPPPAAPGDLGPSPAEPAEAPMGSPPPEAMEELPEAPPPPKPEEEKPGKREGGPPGKDENPYSGSSVRDVLGVLEPLSSTFKERETVRKLSKVDMMMDGLGIVSYFPELGEIIARLIETDSYVSTRLEKIMNKLRGGMREGGEEEKGEAPPAVEMGPPPTEETGAEAVEAPRAEETAAEAVEAPSAPAAEETAAEAVEAPPAGAGG
jgi:hypothetical protein